MIIRKQLNNKWHLFLIHFSGKVISLIFRISNKAGQGIEGPQGSSVFSSSKIDEKKQRGRQILSAVKLSSPNFKVY